MIAPSLVEFEISDRVATALKLENVLQVAVWAGVQDRRFDYSDTGLGTYRIRCSHELAECFIEAIRVFSRDRRQSAEVVEDCGYAIDAINRAQAVREP